MTELNYDCHTQFQFPLMTEADVQTLEKQISNKAHYEALVWISFFDSVTCRLHCSVILLCV